MGKDITAEFARLFPGDREGLLNKSRLVVGTTYVVVVDNSLPPLRGYVITKEEYHGKPTVKSMVASLRSLRRSSGCYM